MYNTDYYSPPLPSPPLAIDQPNNNELSELNEETASCEDRVADTKRHEAKSTKFQFTSSIEKVKDVSSLHSQLQKLNLIELKFKL